MSRKLVIILIILAAFVLRFYHLGQIPVGLYWDEMAMYVDVKSILASGQDMFGRPWYQVIYPSYGDFKLPIYIWSALLSSKIFGLSEWSLRLPSALAGVGTVILAGLLAKEFLQKSFSTRKQNVVQIVTMVVVAFSPWSIMFSRTGFEGHLGQFFLALSLLMVFASRHQPRLLWLAPFFGAVATYAYFSVRFVWLILFVWAVVWLRAASIKKILKGRIQWWQLGRLLILPILLYGILLLPMLRSPLYQDANRFRLGTDSILNQEYQIQTNVYRQLAGNQRQDRIWFNRKILMVQELLKNYSANLSLNFLFVTGDPNLRHGTSQHGVFLLIELPFFVYGFIQLWNRDKKVWLFLIGWWLLALLPASVPANVPHALRALNALVPLSIIIGFGATELLTLWQTLLNQIKNLGWRRLVSLGSWGGLAIICLFSLSQFIYFYFNFYPQLSAKDWQDGYKQLTNAIYHQVQPNQTIVIVPFDDRYYLWLMGYGPYTAQDFHSWKSDKYQFFQFGNQPIKFRGIDEQFVMNAHVPLLVAGRWEKLAPQLAAMKVKPAKVTEVTGHDPKQKFMIAEFAAQ